MSRIRVRKVVDEATRELALEVIKGVYVDEKGWINDWDQQIPASPGFEESLSWFVATVNGRPAGILRLVYDPPLELPRHFKVTFNPDIDLAELSRDCRFVEVGRFGILPRYRRNFRVALRLMRSVLREVVMRGYSHFITDVYENEVHSPFAFHTRILGFEVIGSHLYGDLNCSCTRIILTLDILKGYLRLKRQGGSVYRILTHGIRGIMKKKLRERGLQSPY